MVERKRRPNAIPIPIRAPAVAPAGRVLWNQKQKRVVGNRGRRGRRGGVEASTGTVAHAAATELLAADALLGPDPAAGALGLALLGQLRLGHPAVLGEALATRALGGRADFRLPADLAGQRHVARQHVQVEERQQRRHGRFAVAAAAAVAVVAVGRGRRQRRGGGGVGRVGGQRDGLHLEVAKVRRALGAVAGDEQLDLGQDEAVAAAVVAHALVQVGEAAEVLDLLVVALDAHARVPAVERLDEADDAAEAAAVDELGRVVGVVADERRLAGAVGGAHGEVAAALGEAQRGVELGAVEAGVERVQLGLGLGVGRARRRRRRQAGGRQRDGQQRREVGHGRDRGHVERRPRPHLADVPPEVRGAGVAQPDVELAHQRRRRVGRAEVVEQRGRRRREAQLVAEVVERELVAHGRRLARRRREGPRRHERLGLWRRGRRDEGGHRAVGGQSVGGRRRRVEAGAALVAGGGERGRRVEAVEGVERVAAVDAAAAVSRKAAGVHGHGAGAGHVRAADAVQQRRHVRCRAAAHVAAARGRRRGRRLAGALGRVLERRVLRPDLRQQQRPVLPDRRPRRRGHVGSRRRRGAVRRERRGAGHLRAGPAVAGPGRVGERQLERERRRRAGPEGEAGVEGGQGGHGRAACCQTAAVSRGDGGQHTGRGVYSRTTRHGQPVVS